MGPNKYTYWRIGPINESKRYVEQSDDMCSLFSEV
jgi:hypothetical protein